MPIRSYNTLRETVKNQSHSRSKKSKPHKNASCYGCIFQKKYYSIECTLERYRRTFRTFSLKRGNRATRVYTGENQSSHVGRHEKKTTQKNDQTCKGTNRYILVKCFKISYIYTHKHIDKTYIHKNITGFPGPFQKLLSTREKQSRKSFATCICR